MRKIVLNLAVSLDGFIEGPQGEIDWCFTDQDYGMREFLDRIDAVLMGRKSYELVMRMGPNPFPDKITYVFSKTMKKAADNTRLIRGDAEEAVKNITKQEGKDIWLFGGSVLISTLLDADLVDEMQLSIHPVLLGSGKPLFGSLKERMHVELIETKSHSSGLVQLFYKRVKRSTDGT